MTLFSCRVVARLAAGFGAVIALVLPFSLGAVPAPGASTNATGAIGAHEARVIVKYKADAGQMRIQTLRPGSSSDSAATTRVDGPQHAQALAVRLGLNLRDGRTLGERSQLVHATGLSSAALAAQLAALADVEYAVVDGRMRKLAAPNDPFYGDGQATTPTVGQWYLRVPTSAVIANPSSIVSAINAEAAWAITTGKPGVVVAVLDTGVRFEHPDLAGKLLRGYDFISNTGTANDTNGRDDDASDPGDGVTAADIGVVRGCDASSDIGNSSWHGTQTAGLIGAQTNNSIGMASVGRDVMLLPVRVLGKCGGFDSDIQDALRWAAGIPVNGVPANLHPARVINLSLGSTATCSQAYVDLFQQIAARGVIVVAAAGNDGINVGSPASCPKVIAVAGVRHAGTKVGYSDLGPQVAISAPAGNCMNLSGGCLYPLLTTSNSGSQGPLDSIYTNGSNHITLGTSFSAPLVTGTVALMLSVNSTLTPAEVLAALQASARTFPSRGAPVIQRSTGGPFVDVAECSAPSSTKQDYECYCTTSTCGAGLLDSGAAVALATRVAARITLASTAVVVGTPVSLDGSNSHAADDRSIVSYQWTLGSGATSATFSSPTNASRATLATTGTGSVIVSLTVTDSAGQAATTSATLTVGALPASSGGGAMHMGWLLGWFAAMLALFAVQPRRR